MDSETRMYSFFFFFQAEDGIRDVAVTGVQTCALPIFYALSIGYGIGVSRASAGAPVTYDVLDDGSIKAAMRRYRSTGLDGVDRHARNRARVALGAAATATNEPGGAVVVAPPTQQKG